MRAILLCRQNHNQSTTDLTKVAAQAEKPCNGHAKPKQTAESEECPSFVRLTAETIGKRLRTNGILLGAARRETQITARITIRTVVLRAIH
jgi:hypothetical protein